MSEKLGIKETKEALIAVSALIAFAAERLKDGAGSDDLSALAAKIFMDAEFKKKFEQAFEDANLIDDEMKDLDFPEGAELAKVLLDESLKVVAALKKKAA